MDKLKYIKLENEDGSYSSSIPLAVDSNYVDVNGQNLTTILNNKVNNSEMTILSDEIYTQKSRIDNLAHLEEGSTTGDAELIDARVDTKGRIFNSLGDNIRYNEKEIRNNYYRLDTSEFVIGTTSLNTPTYTEHDNRICTPNFQYANKNLQVHIKSGFKIGVHCFSAPSISATTKQDSAWLQSQDIDNPVMVIPRGVYYRIIIAKSPTEQKVTDIEEYIDSVYFTYIIEDELKISNGYITNLSEIPFRYGNTGSTLGTEFSVIFSLTRVGRSGRILSLPCKFHTPMKFVTYKNSMLCCYRIFLLDDNNIVTYISSWLGTSGQIGDEFKVDIPADTSFIILCSCDLLDIELSQWDFHNPYKTLFFKYMNLYAQEEYDALFPLNPVIDPVDKNLFLGNQNYNLLSIAHQGYSRITSEYFGNSRLDSYLGAYLYGFDIVECDIKWTLDGIPVLSHDDTFVDTATGESVTISTTTLEELKACEYHHQTIATFEEAIALCKQLGLKIQVDHTAIWDSTKWDILFNIVNKYQMKKAVMWGTPNEAIMQIVLNYDNHASCWIFQSYSSDAFNNILSVVRNHRTEYNQFFISFNYTTITPEEIANLNISIPEENINLGVWTIDDLNIYKQYAPYVASITSNKIHVREIMEDRNQDIEHN